MTEPDPTPVPDPEPVEPINPAPPGPPHPPGPPEEEQQTRRPRAADAFTRGVAPMAPQGYAVGGIVPPGNAYMVGEVGPGCVVR